MVEKLFTCQNCSQLNTSFQTTCKNCGVVLDRPYPPFGTRTKRVWKKLKDNVKSSTTKKKWVKLHKGDSQAEVASIIGRPDSIQKEEEESGQETWVYDCGTEGKRAITFKDGFIEKIEVKY